MLNVELEYESEWSGTQETPMTEFEVTMNLSRSLEGELLWNLEAGRLQQLEDVSEGLDSAPAAFCRLMRGENFGKVVVAM